MSVSCIFARVHKDATLYYSLMNVYKKTMKIPFKLKTVHLYLACEKKKSLAVIVLVL